MRPDSFNHTPGCRCTGQNILMSTRSPSNWLQTWKNKQIREAKQHGAQTTKASGLSSFMLQLSPVRFLCTTYGPCSTKRPNMEVPPGPPCNHSRTGDFSLACRTDQDTARGEISAPPSGHFSSFTTLDLGRAVDPVWDRQNIKFNQLMSLI